jgi:hypothetical protein
MSNESLQQLKALVLEEGFDTESRAQVQQLEARLHAVAVKEQLANDPIIKEYIDFLQDQIEQAGLLLRTDRTLTDRQRDALFERIDLASRFTYMFNGKAREDVEKTINELLNVAKTR